MAIMPITYFPISPAYDRMNGSISNMFVIGITSYKSGEKPIHDFLLINSFY